MEYFKMEYATISVLKAQQDIDARLIVNYQAGVKLTDDDSTYLLSFNDQRTALNR